MNSWTLSLAAAFGVLVLFAQPAAADSPQLAVNPAVLTIGADGETGGTDHAIHEVQYRRGRGHGRHHFYGPPAWRPPHRTYRHPGVYAPPRGYRYRHRYWHHGPRRGGVYFYGPRIGIGIGW